jgi:hypothetical protein
LCDERTAATAAALPSVSGWPGSALLWLSEVSGQPADPLPKRYKTCAVVGKARHLTSRRLGKYIDAHDAVMRFNAPAKRWVCSWSFGPCILPETWLCVYVCVCVCVCVSWNCLRGLSIGGV